MTGLLLSHLHHPAASIYLGLACLYAGAAMLSCAGVHRGFMRLYGASALLHAAMGVLHLSGAA